MNALSTKIPAKKLTLIQTVVCLVLVLIICGMSFGTIFSVSIDISNETRGDILEQLDKLSPGSTAGVTIPEKVDVSLPFFISSLGVGFDIIQTLMDGATESVITETTDKGFDQTTVDFVSFIYGMIAGFKESALVGVCSVIMLFMVLIFPISCFIIALSTLIGFLINFKKNPGKAFHKVASAIFSIISLFPILLLMMVLVPELTFGWAIYGILTVCIIALVLNFAVSRLKYYEEPDRKYLNLLQIVSAASLGAFLLFFFSITKTNVIALMFENVAEYTKDGFFEYFTEGTFNILPLILIIVSIVGLTQLFKFMSKIVTRLACMSKSKSSTHIAVTVIGLLAVIAPFILMNTNFNLTLADSEMTAFVLAAIGIVLMLAAEITLKILSDKLCPTVSSKRRKEIVTGTYIYEKAPAEEAPAEEAPVEEAPAEEAPVEEAPAEEAPAEEAPAEETPAE